MSRRFFSDSAILSLQVELDGPEAHHLIHVLRARPQDQVVLFDGSGREFDAEIVDVGRKQVKFRILQRREVDRELPFTLRLAVALPRGDRQEWLVQKAVEMGVTELLPWQTERSVARPQTRSLERLRRTVIEASKQCGRNRLMEILEPVEFGAYVERESGEQISLLAHPVRDAVPLRSMLHRPWAGTGSEIRVGIGPEGGFSDAEAAHAAAAGWQLVQLGPRILRTETAALALAAQIVLLREWAAVPRA